MNKADVQKTIKLLYGTIGAKSDITCTQFLLVMTVFVEGGLTQVEIAQRLGITEGAVSRNIQKLGPDGTGCLRKDGRIIRVDDHVIEAITKIDIST